MPPAPEAFEYLVLADGESPPLPLKELLRLEARDRLLLARVG
jgi:hypothetical protein